LFVPDLRQALNTVTGLWRRAIVPVDETLRWEKLGREAEARGDATTMAFAAKRLSDPEGKRFD
jgi:hypothetical protein